METKRTEMVSGKLQPDGRTIAVTACELMELLKHAENMTRQIRQIAGIVSNMASVAENPVDLSPVLADINWNYIYDRTGGTIALLEYIGKDEDVKVYSHYMVDDSPRLLRAVMYDGSSIFVENERIRKVTFSDHVDTSMCEKMSYMFSHCKNLESVNFGTGFNTANTKYMDNMFAGCESLTELDLSCFDTDQVQSMQYIFAGCKNLKHVSVSDTWKTNQANISGMLDGCCWSPDFFLSKTRED